MILILAALCPWFWGLVALLTLAGISMGISNIAANTLLQANIPAHLRGQTVSLYMLAMRGGLSIGSLLTGISASWLGVSWALLVNGVLAVLLQSLVGYRWMRAPAPDLGNPE